MSVYKEQLRSPPHGWKESRLIPDDAAEAIRIPAPHTIIIGMVGLTDRSSPFYPRCCSALEPRIAIVIAPCNQSTGILSAPSVAYGARLATGVGPSDNCL